MGKFDQLLPDIIKLANATDEVDTLYLYGSHAKGSAQENSDIDLAVIFKNTFLVSCNPFKGITCSSPAIMITSNNI